MSGKHESRNASKTAQNDAIPGVDPLHPDTQITKRNLFAAYLESGHQLIVGLQAWERFGEDVVAFLKAHELGDAFGAFQQQRHASRRKAAAAVNAKRRARR